MRFLALTALLAACAGLFVSLRAADSLEIPSFELGLRGRPIGTAMGAPSGSTAEDSEEGAPQDVVDADGFVDLEHFTFSGYDPPELRPEAVPLGPEEFPAVVGSLDGREIGLMGYMIVTEYADRALTSFLLSRFPPGCCFGAMPVADEWVAVELAGEGIDAYSPYQSLALRGRLEVGERLDEDGFCQSLYRLKAARIVEH